MVTIEEIKRLNEGRTQGEWVKDEDWVVEKSMCRPVVYNNNYDDESEFNTAFIAAAPAIAELAIAQAEEIERLWETMKAMEQSWMCLKDEYSELARALGLNGDAWFDDPIAEHKEIVARAKRLREALKFIASGCLVPPDGGSPCFEDAIEAAKQALGESE